MLFQETSTPQCCIEPIYCLSQFPRRTNNLEKIGDVGAVTQRARIGVDTLLRSWNHRKLRRLQDQPLLHGNRILNFGLTLQDQNISSDLI